MPEPVRHDPMPGAAALWLYRSAGRLLGPFVTAVLHARARSGKEDPGRRGERQGVASRARPAGPLVWVHAASVGETMAVLPLIGRLLEHSAVLLTTGTVTSARLAADLLPASAVHQYAPVDTPQSLDRFLRHWRPDLALFVESELWPAALEALRRSGVSLVLVNARLSERSYRKWRRFAPVAAALMNRIPLCLAQTELDAMRLRSLGAGHVVVCGNLKFDVPPPAADPAELDRFRIEIAGRPVLLAASTHPGEHGAVLQAHAAASRQQANSLTIIAPRHPQKSAELAQRAAKAGFRSALRSQGGRIEPGTEVYVADTIGEMGLWYRLANMVILGGSMIRHGGQNPIEAAKLNVPILHGPHVGNFADIYAALDRCGGTKAVRDQGSLVTAVLELLRDPTEGQRMAAAARDCLLGFAGALDRVTVELQPYLQKIRDSYGEP